MPRLNQITSLPNDKGDVYETVKEHRFGLYETMGVRLSQEDAAFACWYTQDHFDLLTPKEIGRRLWTSYHLINTLGRNAIHGGTTASTTVYDGRGNLITATLADSVSFAVVYGKNGELVGVARLNKVIHHPNTEWERIKRAGGMICFGRVNGQLAVSRAIGDFDYNPAVVCADASIDINRLDEIYERFEISPEHVGKVQIITTCDGFTEPLLSHETQKDHEQWLFNCLSDIALPSTQEEHHLAKMLATRALACFSKDNISIAVQAISQSMPFLVGIYDGHGGKGASSYTAENIGDIFDQQCSLSQEAYAQQALSADRKFMEYYRDNKDQEWYEPLAEVARKTRETALSRPDGVLAQMELLKAKADEFQATAKDESKDTVLLVCAAVQNLYNFMKVLCNHYVDLTLSDKEFVECARHILEFENTKYIFLSLNFKECRENGEIIKKERAFQHIIMNLKNAAVSIFHF